MTKIAPVLTLLLFMMPSVSFAAALTPQQSSSLIAVVQSSPGTPASAFVSLITAFSNITTTQASSLITVVQAAPSVPASAFVDLLTSFTVDTVATQPATPAPTPVVTTQPTQNNQQVTQSATPTPIPTSTNSQSITQAQTTTVCNDKPEPTLLGFTMDPISGGWNAIDFSQPIASSSVQMAEMAIEVHASCYRGPYFANQIYPSRAILTGAGTLPPTFTTTPLNDARYSVNEVQTPFNENNIPDKGIYSPVFHIPNTVNGNQPGTYMATFVVYNAFSSTTFSQAITVN